MTLLIKTPFLGANDSEAKLTDWFVQDGEQVSKGTDICSLETTKASIDVQAEADGHVFHAVAEGDVVQVDQIIAVMSDDAGFDVQACLADLKAQEPEEAQITKKAELLIKRNKLDPDAVAAFANGRKIDQDLIGTYIDEQRAARKRIGFDSVRRIGIIGGVAGGGALIVADAISRIAGLRAVAIYDRDASFHDQEVLGVPVVGTLDQLEADRDAGKVDAIVLAFNRNLDERHRIFEELSGEGYEFANIIDPTADLRSNVTLGTGNVILGHAYVGACSEIGNNNFISANVALEHGNVLGDANAFGPGVFTSGNVKIGDRVRFGTGIFIEPSVSIGDDATIGSGQTIVTDIRSGVTLTSSTRS